MRPLRNQSPGFHHVVTRGNDKQAIYLDDVDRRLFCLAATRVARRNGWEILAYVLMRNHYHLLLWVGEQGMSRGMHDLNHTHAVTFNTRHERINHLFGKRYWSRHLTSEAAIAAAARYIVQNPPRAGVGAIDGYRWSSYRATLGLEFAHMTLATEKLLGFFGRTPALGRSEFERYCRGIPDAAEVA